MEQQSAMAVLRFPAQDASLHGTVTSMSTQDINVRLNSSPLPDNLFAKGTCADLVVLARDLMYTAATEVMAEKHGIVRLQFTTGVHTVPRRRHARVAVALEVNFRIVQDTGCFGSWRRGVTKDISFGGMCLVIETGFEAPRNIEVIFALPNYSIESQLEAAPGGEEHSEILKLVALNRSAAQRAPNNKEKPIRTSARVCKHFLLPEGRTALGLAFTAVNPADQVRLERFLNAPWHPIV